MDAQPRFDKTNHARARHLLDAQSPSPELYYIAKSVVFMTSYHLLMAPSLTLNMAVGVQQQRNPLYPNASDLG